MSSPATISGESFCALGVDVGGDRLADGSGLSTADRLSPALLVALLRVAASAQHPELHPLFAGLPVGGYDGCRRGTVGARRGHRARCGLSPRWLAR